VSDYPNQSRSQGGWPTQPPQSSPPGRQAYAQAYPQAAPPRRRRRGRRAATVLIIVLVLLVALFVAADRILAAYTQNMIASTIQTQADLSAKPSVTIKGFPFLTQVAARDVRQVDISATNVTAAKTKVTISSLTATATGVHINSSFNGATIDQINGSVLITYSALENVLQIPGATIAADPSGGANAVTIGEGSLASATGHVTLTSANRVTVQLDSLGGLAGLLSGAFGSSSSYNLTIPALPIGLKVTGLSTTSQGVVLRASAHDTTLSK
jgi:hypothetical protein